MLQTTFDQHPDKFTLDKVFLRSVPRGIAVMALEGWVSKVRGLQIVDISEEDAMQFIWGKSWSCSLS